MAAMAIHQRNAIVRHRHCVAVGVDCGWRRILMDGWRNGWMRENGGKLERETR